MHTFDEKKFRDSLSKHQGNAVIKMTPVSGGYTLAKRYIVDFENGKSLFAKVAINEDTQSWLRSEYNFYKSSKADFHPKLIGWKDDSETFLLLEDLSQGDWSKNWNEAKIQAVLKGIGAIRKTKVYGNIPKIMELHSDLFRWDEIKSNPDILLDSGIQERAILEDEFEKMTDLSDLANIEGTDLVHMDIRSDNTCFINNRAVFVDWNHVCIGNSALDTIFWLPSLHLEGGPAPWSFDMNEPELIALIIGYFAFNTSKLPPHAGSELRDFQRKQLSIMYKWLKQTKAL